jgi:hypothetical protein
MHRLLVLAVCLMSIALLPGCAQMQSMTGQSADITTLLTKQLGVTDAQAGGGVGAMLKLAQEKLSAGEFDQIAKAIPGADKYLANAKQLLGGANIGNKAGLQGAFSKLGMSPSMVDQFIPLVTQFVGQTGGEQAKSLLAGALK